MDDIFQVTVEERAGVPIVRAAGEVDVSTAPTLRERLVDLPDGTPRVIVDLSEVTFLDSTGLGVLVAGQKRLRAPAGAGDEVEGTPGGLDLVVTRPQILKVLEVTGLTSIFTIYSSLDEAIAR
ncbi:MAG TPA: STAS domain-containing protein [Acidimicrobiales bacterium]|nr:STAS domain-containing protein [Acidimicrobiales bacterium]